MSLFVVVEPRADFERWLRAQAAPSVEPRETAALDGRARFVENGCGACHAVRGTVADGQIGPDLTHVGGRRSIAAGVLKTEPEAFRRFVTRANEIKPSAHMPAFGMLPPEAVTALSAYLQGLE
jgi:cytochrome c oxidase subunit 2